MSEVNTSETGTAHMFLLVQGAVVSGLLITATRDDLPDEAVVPA